MRLYGDPVDRDITFEPGDQLDWGEGDERTGESRLVLYLPIIIPGRSGLLTYGAFVEALIGLNQVRLDYPMLEIQLLIVREGLNIGRLVMYTEEPDEPDDS